MPTLKNVRIKVRKKVRFPGKNYRYVYCKHSWKEVPSPGDPYLDEFMVKWGRGSYHFIDTSTGKLVSTTSGDGMDYRCVADGHGNPRNYKEEYQKQQERAEVEVQEFMESEPKAPVRNVEESEGERQAERCPECGEPLKEDRDGVLYCAEDDCRWFESTI